MKFFWKIFLPVLVALLVVAVVLSYLMASNEIEDEENQIVNEISILGNYISKEIEMGSTEGRWPFETLKEIENNPLLVFWWIVNQNGIIHLADDTSFMQTKAYEYFPDLLAINNGSLFINEKEHYGIYRKQVALGREKGSFWIGFSLESITQMKKEILTRNIVLVLLLISILSVYLFFVINHFTKPIISLKEASEKVAGGNLNVSIRKLSSDELGGLALSFNGMVKKLRNNKKITQKEIADKTKQLQNVNLLLDQKVKVKTKELQKAKEELDRKVQEKTSDLKNAADELDKARGELEKKNKELENTLEDFYTMRIGMQKDLELGKVEEENKKIKERIEKLKKSR